MQLTQDSSHGRALAGRVSIVRGLAVVALAAIAFTAGAVTMQLSHTSVAPAAASVYANSDPGYLQFRAGERGDPGTTTVVTPNSDPGYLQFRAGERGDAP
jgi:hypothetical protein